MMKKTFAAAMALSMLALAGCSNQPSNNAYAPKTPEELTTLYADAITANGGEMVEYNPVISEFNEETAMFMEMLGLEADEVTACGVSTSMMMVKAYGIAAVMPAEGEHDDVVEDLQAFIDLKQSQFEFYLPDQYEISLNARLETLEDGTVLMVMTEDQDTVFENISKTILGK